MYFFFFLVQNFEKFWKRVCLLLWSFCWLFANVMKISNHVIDFITENELIFFGNLVWVSHFNSWKSEKKVKFPLEKREKRLRTAFNLEKKESSYSMLCEAKRKRVDLREKGLFRPFFFFLRSSQQPTHFWVKITINAPQIGYLATLEKWVPKVRISSYTIREL